MASKNALCKKRLHRMTAANTYEHPQKGSQCRSCFRDYMRDYMSERRAAEKKAAAKKKRAR